MAYWRIVRRCMYMGAAGVTIGFVLALVLGTALAYVLYPEATAYTITGRGGTSTADFQRVFQIRLSAAAAGFLFGLLVSQTALIIQAVHARGRATHCQNCGYDFRGHTQPRTTSITCPECGTVAAG